VLASNARVKSLYLKIINGFPLPEKLKAGIGW
jgi:hypothetical protein